MGKKWMKRGIKMRLISSLLVIALPMTAVLGWMIYRNIVKRTIQADRKEAERVTENVVTLLESYQSEVSVIARDCNYNYNLQQFLIEELKNEEYDTEMDPEKSMQKYELVSGWFDSTLQQRPDITSIMIFGKNRMIIQKSIYTNRVSNVSIADKSWYRDAVRHPGEIISLGLEKHDFLVGKTQKTLSYSSVIQKSSDGSFLGVILVDYNLNKISEILDSVAIKEKEGIALINRDGQLIYEGSPENSLGKKFGEGLLEGLREDGAGGGEGKTGWVADRSSGRNYQYVSRRMDSTGWSVVRLREKQDLLQDAKRSMLALQITVFLIMAMSFLVLNFSLNHMIQPIIQLQRRIQTLSLETLKESMPVRSRDEIGVLTEKFNEMTYRISDLTEQLVMEQKEKRHYELRALQAQINPHFLYNTLDSIIWMAETQNPEVVPMTEALARLMRLSLNKGKEFITCEEELEQVQNYLIIQEMRYRGKFEYSIKIDEAVRKCRVVKLIVQPIVENSIYHGIKEKKGKSRIDVSAWKDGDALSIRVSDDGVGMSRQVLDGLLDTERYKGNQIGKGNGIGVKNVNERIRLEYGEAYGITYTSQPGEGTSALIRLPLQWMTEGGAI